MCVCPAGWAHCGRVVVSRVCFRSPLVLPVWWNGRHARLKSGCPVGRAGSTPATGTGGGETVEYGACRRVLWPTLGRVALWLVPPVGRLVSCVWRMVCGFLLRVLRALCVCCFVSPVLDSNPAWLLGPTANRFAHVIVGGVRFLCCPLGSMLLPVGVSLAFALAGGAWASLFSLSGPCSCGCRAAWAGAPSGVLGYLPFIYGLAAAGAVACVSGTRDPLVWGWCGFRACRCWGVGDDGMPRDCAYWVRLRGFLACALRVAVFSWCRVRFRVVACGGVAALVCASFTGADLRCVSVVHPACLVLWRGVLLCASRCRSVVCLPFVCGGSALCLFVAVCVV